MGTPPSSGTQSPTVHGASRRCIEGLLQLSPQGAGVPRGVQQPSGYGSWPRRGQEGLGSSEPGVKKTMQEEQGMAEASPRTCVLGGRGVSPLRLGRELSHSLGSCNICTVKAASSRML